MGDGADGGEEPINDAKHGGGGALGSGNDGGGSTDEGGGVGHGADDGGGEMTRAGGRLEKRFDLGDGDAGEDADEEFAFQGGYDGGIGDAAGEVLGLAAQEDNVCFLDDIGVFSVVGNGDGNGELFEFVFKSFG